MKQRLIFYIKTSLAGICIAMLLSVPMTVSGQQMMINMAAIDGIGLTPANIFAYTIQSPLNGNVQIKGNLRYRNSGLSLSYIYEYHLEVGMNHIERSAISPQWQFSSSSLRELFLTYNTLPEGTYEYCVTITPQNAIPENPITSFDECLFHRSDGLFMINLVEPANNAKLQELNPALAWVANYSFSNDLAYRIRIAEIKQGQNAVNAVMRNQPVYAEKNLMQNSIIYPVYAKPLEKNKPYAWTVDAYFREILLGGSETWQFIIPEDTLRNKYPAVRSFIDIKRETGVGQIYILGELKLKYLLDKTKSDVLDLQLVDEGDLKISLKPEKLEAVYGDNRYTLNLVEGANLKHLGCYKLGIRSQTGERYTISFKYLNPDYVR